MSALEVTLERACHTRVEHHNSLICDTHEAATARTPTAATTGSDPLTVSHAALLPSTVPSTRRSASVRSGFERKASIPAAKHSSRLLLDVRAMIGV